MPGTEEKADLSFRLILGWECSVQRDGFQRRMPAPLHKPTALLSLYHSFLGRRRSSPWSWLSMSVYVCFAANPVGSLTEWS